MNKYSILCIGTELTTGQILNRNANWISSRLKENGIEVEQHLIVPDDVDLIQKSLKFLSDSSQVIFVTGGLGPTSDDFTREMISQFIGQPLEYDEDSWQHIIDRLTPRGIAVREIQKQQCYFPKGSKILKNREGTANGFQVQSPKQTFVVLPGPPRELEAIWMDHLSQDPLFRAPERLKIKTHHFDCLGIGESEVAHRASQVLKDCPFPVGYRVHLPYVELKITYSESENSLAQTFIEKVRHSLNGLEVFENARDAADLFGEKLLALDDLTVSVDQGLAYLIRRLSEKSPKIWNHPQIKIESISDPTTLNTKNWIRLIHLGENDAELQFHIKGQIQKVHWKSPYETKLLRERKSQYFIEKMMWEISKH